MLSSRAYALEQGFLIRIRDCSFVPKKSSMCRSLILEITADEEGWQPVENKNGATWLRVGARRYFACQLVLVLLDSIQAAVSCYPRGWPIVNL